MIPLTGWLSAAFSLNKYLMVNSILFVLFSICCGQTHSLDLMILFRVAQGFTGGVLIPLSFVAILTYLPPSKQPAVTVYSGALQERVLQSAAYFMSEGSDPYSANMRAIAKRTIR